MTVNLRETTAAKQALQRGAMTQLGHDSVSGRDDSSHSAPIAPAPMTSRLTILSRHGSVRNRAKLYDSRISTLCVERATPSVDKHAVMRSPSGATSSTRKDKRGATFLVTDPWGHSPRRHYVRQIGRAHV